jgi:lysophospholipase L1-like esterase
MESLSHQKLSSDHFTWLGRGQLTARKKIFLSLVGMTLALIALEFSSFSILLLYDLLNRVPLKSALENRSYELRSPWNKATFFGDFDPVLQVRHVPGSHYDHVLINKDGFIGNGHNNELLNAFPQKPNGLYRAILLGGSTMAGAGAERNSQTIPAYLESLLNQGNDKSGRKFQALNFGAAGGYTGAELWKFLSQLVYFEPNMVVCWDGFNDAWNSRLENYRVKIDHPIINWSDYSYEYFELMNGYRRSTPLATPKVMTFSFILADKVLHRLHGPPDTRPLYERLPLYHHSKYIQTKYPFYENVIASNLDTFAAYAVTHPNLTLLAYLQPQAYTWKPLSPSEKRKLEFWHRAYVSTYGPEFGQMPFIAHMVPVFESYAKIYEALSEKYKPYKNIRFMDARDIFRDVKEDTYIDPAHYTDLGNRIIARRIHDDVKKVLPTGD